MRRSLVAILTLLATAVMAVGCGEAATEPEQQVRDWVATAQEFAESKQRRALVDLISPDYADARGNDREAVENMLRVYFLRQHSVALISTIDEVRLFGSTAAEVDLTVGMAGTNDGVLGFSADAYKFELELLQDDDDWQLIAARWAQVGDELR